MTDDLKSKILNYGLRQDLARNIPVLSRLENFKGLTDLRLVAVHASEPADEKMYVEYRASAEPEVHRRLKSALVEGGVIGKYAPTTQTIRGRAQNYMHIYFLKEGVDVELRVSPKKGG